MLVASIIGRVRAVVTDVVKPTGRRRRQAHRLVAAEFFSELVEQLEQRVVLSAPELGPELSEHELSTVFAEVNGRRGDSRVFDGVLYVPGATPESPVVGTLNLQTGEKSTLTMDGLGAVSGIFKKNGEVSFTGFAEAVNNSQGVASWDKTGKLTLIPDASSSLAMDVSSTGRMSLAINNDVAGYADVGENILHHLPGIAGFRMIAQSITDDNRFIGARGSDINFNTVGVVYELNSTTGEYVLSNADFKTSRGEGMDSMSLFESPNGVLSASLYDNPETYQDETAIFSLDGTVRAELPGVSRGEIAVGEKFFVATQGDDGYLTVFNSGYEKMTYTTTELFGAGFEFRNGSLAMHDGKLIVIGTRISDGKVLVKTFEVPQDVTILAQVDVASIVIPQLTAGQSGNITWDAVSGASGYELSFIRGGVVAHTVTTTGAAYTTPVNLLAGDYRLAIRAVGGAGVAPGAWSAEKALVVKPTPVLASSITGFPTVATRNPVTFRWTAATGATGYEVIVSSVSQLPASSRSLTVTQPTAILPDGLEAGTWRLAVRPVTGSITGDWTTSTLP